MTDSLPQCDTCGATLEFAKSADPSADGRVYLIFRCAACAAGETRVWRSEWPTLAEALAADD